MNEDIQLKESPAYEKLGREVDITLEDCPAYVEQRSILPTPKRVKEGFKY